MEEWLRFGLVATWASVDPERNRNRVYTLRWELSMFGPALRAEWGRGDRGPRQTWTWWPDEQGRPAEDVEKALIRRRLAHGYVETSRGPAFPQNQTQEAEV